MKISELCIMVSFDNQYNIRILIFVRMEIHVNNCIMHEDNYYYKLIAYNIYMMIRQMVICTIDHTDGDLHNDQTYFDI